MHMGEPAISFTEEEELLFEPYKFILVSKFSNCRPSMAKVGDDFYKFGFHGDFYDRLY